jgi:hypothetical protein
MSVMPLPLVLLPCPLHPAGFAAAQPGGTVMAMAERLGAEVFLRQQRAIKDRPDTRPPLPRIIAPTAGLEGALP